LTVVTPMNEFGVTLARSPGPRENTWSGGATFTVTLLVSVFTTNSEADALAIVPRTIVVVSALGAGAAGAGVC
jgi:hypothetical protein